MLVICSDIKTSAKADLLGTFRERIIKYNLVLINLTPPTGFLVTVQSPYKNTLYKSIYLPYKDKVLGVAGLLRAFL